MSTLTRAAAVLEERGHAKHELMTHDGRVCVIGAILVASGAPDRQLKGFDTFGISAEAHETAAVSIETLRRSLVERELIQDDVEPFTHGRVYQKWNGNKVAMWNNFVADADDAVHALKLADEYAATHDVQIVWDQ